MDCVDLSEFIDNLKFIITLFYFFSVSLRLQLTSSSEFKSVSPEKAFGDFAFCCLVLFFVVFSFMG